MEEFPSLQTKRLKLRKLSSADIPYIVKYAGNPKVAETTLNIPHPYAEKDAQYWITTAEDGFNNKTQFTFGIEHKIQNEFIGGIGLKLDHDHNRAEFGYWIAEPFWSQGYATEALAALLKFGFEELSLQKIYAHHLSKNPASGKVMTNNHMLKEAELKEHIKKGNDYEDLIQFRLTRTEYFASKSK